MPRKPDTAWIPKLRELTEVEVQYTTDRDGVSDWWLVDTALDISLTTEERDVINIWLQQREWEMAGP